MAKNNISKPVASENQELYAFIASLMAKKPKKDSLTPTTNLMQLGFNSLKFFRVLRYIEEKSGAEMESIISRFDLTSIKTIGDINNVIEHFRKK